MKRFFALMMSILLILTTSQAAILTLHGPDCTITMTSAANKRITLADLKSGIRWWKVLSGGVDVIDNKFVMPGNDVEVQPMYEGNQIVVQQTSNGTITPGTTETTEGNNYAFTITPNSGYKIATLTVDGVSETVTNETGMTYTFTNVQENHVITATYEVGTAAPNGANAPVLATGLTPVNWNGSSWTTTTESSWDYNYNSVAEATHSTVAGNGDGKWANAQTADGSLYVWIPRYTYKITSGEHLADQKSWNSLDDPGTAKIEIKFSNGTIDDTSNSYIKHPAFTFGTDELQGIWVAKYEASQGNTTSELSAPTSSNSVAKSIPGVASWRSISVSNTFDYAYNTYRNADSHLMKNTEWGAVAYLTNAIGRIPYINNSSSFVTGNAGGSQNAASASGTTNAWNTVNGVKASTTHNVYGIYDMSGGSWEYVAAYVNNGHSNLSSFASSLVNAATKYKDTYPVGSSDSGANNYAAWSSIKGDAVYETSSSSSGSTSWDGDYSGAPNSGYPVFARGGGCHDDSYAGVFFFGGSDGDAGSGHGFRVVLTGVEPVAPTTYTITYNLDGGTVATANPTSYTIESNAITLNNPTKDGYNFTGWTGTGLAEATTTVTIPTGSTGDRTYTANWEVAVIEPNADTSGANAPVLATGLTPVNWNGSVWETTTESNWKYNYNSVATSTQTNVEGNGDSAWANAQTADGSLYVWIPRYTYKITSGEHSSGNSWNSLDAAGTNKIEVKFSNGTTDDTSNSYIKHPAFTFGDEELQGIWVAKYEASRGNTTSELSVPTSSNSVAKSIPGVASWRNITVSNMFDYAYNTYRNADSHLMKNVEWGAVAYLTNAIGRIPYINNSSKYITGNAGGSQDAASASGTTNAWNTVNGVKASTTHNVYGIYDMSGGSWEYVAAYVNNGHGNLSSFASSLVNAATKYKDVYPKGSSDSQANNYAAWSSIKGDAVYETSSSSSGSTSWDGDYSSAPRSGFPVFERGGRYGDSSCAGVFCFSNYYGTADSTCGFRVVLTGVEPVAPTTYTITYNLDGGTVATANPTSYTSADTITLNNPTKDGYNFTGWTGTGLAEATTTVTIPTGSTGDRTYTANWEVAVIEPNVDTSGANVPVLATGLTPVNWNGTAWETTTSANWKYNYNSVATATQTNVEGNGDSAWANAQTADGSLYVWIPRYTYKITSGNHSSGNSWNSLDNPGTNKIEVKFSNGTTDDTSNSYIKHPAFTFGTDELQGIWVAKYEASQGSTTNETSAPTSSTSVAKSIPGVASWRDISVSNMFDYAYNTYRNADSHLMKNTEWGAVAYLTNAIGRIPYINNSSSYITGNAGGSQDAAGASGTTNAWNTAGGVKASTTHNVYGIYDMSGGAYEYVATYYTGQDSTYTYDDTTYTYAGKLSEKMDSKYVDIYEFDDIYDVAYNSNIRNDAVYDTSSSYGGEVAWDGDSSYAPNSYAPVFVRGGVSDNYNASWAGIFSFNSYDGSSLNNCSFRVVLGIR